LVTRGQAYERLGNRVKALADFNAALVLVPDLRKAKDGVKRLTERQRSRGGQSLEPDEEVGGTQ
jgi:hypothetical protein